MSRSLQHFDLAARNHSARLPEAERSAFDALAAKLRAPVATYATEAAKIASDQNLSEAGRQAALAEARQKAERALAGINAAPIVERIARLEQLAAAGAHLDADGQVVRPPAVQTDSHRAREIRDRALAMEPKDRNMFYRDAIRLGRREVVEALEGDPAGLTLTPEQIEQGQRLRMETSPMRPAIEQVGQILTGVEQLQSFASRAVAGELSSSVRVVTSDDDSGMRARLAAV